MSIKKQQGFTLFEMAIVFVIFAALAGTLLIPLAQKNEIRDRQIVQEDLERIRQVLLGFAIQHQRFPCPIDISSSPQNDGVEDGINNSGAAESDSGDIVRCAVKYGYLPFQTLGLTSQSTSGDRFTDPWGNNYRYSVVDSYDCSGDVDEWDFVTRGRMLLEIARLEPEFEVCSEPTCANTSKIVRYNSGSKTGGTPVVIFSMGKNWGNHSASFTLENENVDSDNIFMMLEENSDDSSASRFDDIVTWISPNMLYSHLIQSGLYPDVISGTSCS